MQERDGAQQLTQNLAKTLTSQETLEQQLSLHEDRLLEVLRQEMNAAADAELKFLEYLHEHDELDAARAHQDTIDAHADE